MLETWLGMSALTEGLCGFRAVFAPLWGALHQGLGCEAARESYALWGVGVVAEDGIQLPNLPRLSDTLPEQTPCFWPWGRRCLSSGW